LSAILGLPQLFNITKKEWLNNRWFNRLLIQSTLLNRSQPLVQSTPQLQSTLIQSAQFGAVAFFRVQQFDYSMLQD
jgi:hypothetical protein